MYIHTYLLQSSNPNTYSFFSTFSLSCIYIYIVAYVSIPKYKSENPSNNERESINSESNRKGIAGNSTNTNLNASKIKGFAFIEFENKNSVDIAVKEPPIFYTFDHDHATTTYVNPATSG